MVDMVDYQAMCGKIPDFTRTTASKAHRTDHQSRESFLEGVIRLNTIKYIKVLGMAKGNWEASRANSAPDVPLPAKWPNDAGFVYQPMPG